MPRAVGHEMYIHPNEPVNFTIVLVTIELDTNKKDKPLCKSHHDLIVTRFMMGWSTRGAIKQMQNRAMFCWRISVI